MTIYMLTHLDHLRGRLVRDLRAIAQAPTPVTCRLRDFLVVRTLFAWDTHAWRGHNPEETCEREEQDTALEIHFLRRLLQEMQSEFGLSLEDCGTTARMLLLATDSLVPDRPGGARVHNREEVSRMGRALAETLVQGLVPTRRVGWQESPRIDSTAL